VYSALDKRSQKVVGIKVIPGVCVAGDGAPLPPPAARHSTTLHFLCSSTASVEAEIDEMMKEIEILKRCHSDYIVGYDGSYLKDGDLWVRVVWRGG
jgi:hypothetical protein